MAPFPVRQNHGMRLPLANFGSDGKFVLFADFKARVGKAEIGANGNAHDFSSALRFLKASFRSAARAHFAARQVEDAGFVSELRHFDERAAAGELHVVRVRSDCEQVEFHSASGDSRRNDSNVDFFSDTAWQLDLSLDKFLRWPEVQTDVEGSRCHVRSE